MLITVKDLINYLLQYPMDTEIILDKNGWQGSTIDEAISGVIDDSAITQRGEDYLTINN